MLLRVGAFLFWLIMPVRLTLTGRRERQNDRARDTIRRRSARTAHVVDNNNNDDNSFVESFRSALNFFPRNFRFHNLGPMDKICIYCNARHFEMEITGGDENKFTLCCHKGKVQLDPLSQNLFFNSFYDNLSSSNPSVRGQAKNYFEQIRKYNAAFAMISSECKFDSRVMHGVYHFKIHDTFYHRAFPMAAQGDSPSYAQLYFYDTDIANAYRMGNVHNANCDATVMRLISN